MAFGTKYRATFDVELPDSGPIYRTWTVDLKKEAGAGATALTTSGTPLRIQAVKENPDLPYGIIRTSAVLEVVGEDSAYDEIRAAQPKSWVMNVTSASAGLFVGYVEPKRMRKVVGAGPVPQQIIATDGIDFLRAVDWYASQAAANTAGFRTVLQIIDDCLGNLPFDASAGYGYITSAKWYHYGSEVGGWTDPTDPEDPLVNYSHNVGYLYKKIQEQIGGSEASGIRPSCYDVLTHILARWQLRLQFSKSRWRVYQTPYFDSSGSGQYEWVYGNTLSQTGEAFQNSGVSVTWDDTNLTGDGDQYVIEHGPWYERARVTFEHDATAESILASFYDGSTINWSNNGSPTTSRHPSFRFPDQLGVASQAVQIADIKLNTESSIANLGTVDAVRDDWYAFVPAGDNLYIYYDSPYPITGSVDNDLSFYTSALYQHDPAQMVSDYQYYLAGFAIGLDDGTNQYWLKTDGTWVNAGASGTAPSTTETDEEIWTVECVPGAPTPINIGPFALPSSSDLMTVQVRLYQGMDTYYGVNGSTDTITAFAWGPTRVGLTYSDANESTSAVTTVENTATASFDVVAETFYTGTGPLSDSPARIAGPTTPFNDGVFDSWTTDSGVTGTGTDTSYTLDNLWGRELLKQYGNSPQVLRARLRVLTATADAFAPHYYLVLGSTDYWLRRCTITASKGGMVIDVEAQEIRQDSITYTVTPLNPNPWPPNIDEEPLGIDDIVTIGGGESGGGGGSSSYTDVHPCTVAVYDCQPGADSGVLYDRLTGDYNGTLGSGTSFDSYGLVSSNGYASLPTALFNTAGPMTILFAIGDEDAATWADNDFDIIDIEHGAVTTIKLSSAASTNGGNNYRGLSTTVYGSSNPAISLIPGEQTILGAIAFTPDVAGSSGTGTASTYTIPMLYALPNQFPGVMFEIDTTTITSVTWPATAPDYVRIAQTGSGKSGKLLWMEVLHCHLGWDEIKPQLDRIRANLDARSIPGDDEWEGVDEDLIVMPPRSWCQPPGTSIIIAPSSGSWTDAAALRETMYSVEESTSASGRGYLRDTLGRASSCIYGGAATYTLRQRGLYADRTAHQGRMELPGDLLGNGQFTLIHVVGHPGGPGTWPTVELDSIRIHGGASIFTAGSLQWDLDGTPSNGIRVYLASSQVASPSPPTTVTHVDTSVFASGYDQDEANVIILRVDVYSSLCEVVLINNTQGGMSFSGNLWNPATSWDQAGDSSIAWWQGNCQSTGSMNGLYIFQYYQMIRRVLTDYEIEELYLALRPWLIQTRGVGSTELPVNP